MRKLANAPEQSAWATLRQLRARGFPVRRQHPIGRYIVDFAIVKAKLIIEIDGTIHNRDDVKASDNHRQKALESLGWRVIRFSGDEALHADYLIAEIETYLGAVE